LRSLRLFPCGGADVPPALIRRAIRRLGVRSGRGYGSTEFPSITSSAGPDVPEAKRAETDGAVIPPGEIELRDAGGCAAATGRVPSPGARLGERACAFVVPADERDPPTLPALVRFLEGLELSRRKLPERLELVDALPATASGKVQKHVLRERIAARLRREGRS